MKFKTREFLAYHDYKLNVCFWIFLEGHVCKRRGNLSRITKILYRTFILPFLFLKIVEFASSFYLQKRFYVENILPWIKYGEFLLTLQSSLTSSSEIWNVQLFYDYEVHTRNLAAGNGDLSFSWCVESENIAIIVENENIFLFPVLIPSSLSLVSSLLQRSSKTRKSFSTQK